MSISLSGYVTITGGIFDYLHYSQRVELLRVVEERAKSENVSFHEILKQEAMTRYPEEWQLLLCRYGSIPDPNCPKCHGQGGYTGYEDYEGRQVKLWFVCDCLGGKEDAERSTFAGPNCPVQPG